MKAAKARSTVDNFFFIIFNLLVDNYKMMLQNYNIFQKLPNPKAPVVIEMMKSTPFWTILYLPSYKQKRGPATASPQDERDISVDLVNNEANHFALYL